MTRPVLRTRICDLLGMEYPILLAGMGPAAGGVGPAATAPLVAAVSEAGGLGVIGGTGFSADDLRQEIRQVRERTSKPFGVDLLFPSNVAPMPKPANGGARSWRDLVPQQCWDALDELRRQFNLPTLPPRDRERESERALRSFRMFDVKAQVQVVIEERVPVLASGLGNPEPFIAECHRVGTKVISVVGNVKNARRVAASGVDAVVAQGTEGGGHTGRIGTLALVPQAVDAVAPVPVIAAGGIADGRGLVAALALGAEGVWCGTAFLATREANLTDLQKSQIVAATEEDTRVTRIWSGKTMRNVTNPLIEAWENLGVKALPMGLQGLMISDLVVSAKVAGREDLLMNAAGQISGMLREVQPARDVLAGMVGQAADLLANQMPKRVQTGVVA